MLDVNKEAPNFTLSDADGNPVELRQFTDQQNVVLVFYPFDWSPVCSDQISLFNEMKFQFDKRDAVLIGISTDSTYCHAAFSENRKLHFPLLSDFEPKGKVARTFGAYNEKEGHCHRALFVIDKNQMIVWNHLVSDTENPEAEGILNALDDIISKSLV